MEVRGELMHNHLWGYKNNQDELVRTLMSFRPAALLEVFVRHHRECIGEWDVVTCVPSVKRVALEPIVRSIPELARGYRQVLQELPGRPSHQLSVEHFEVIEPLNGRRVLLLDDTCTSGAAVFSSVEAIRRAGGEVVGPVVIGRFVDSTK